MLRIYLDVCVYNRPFDSQSDERVALETSIFIYLLEGIEKGNYQLITSESLEFENEKNPDLQRKARVSTYFKLSEEYVRYEDTDSKRVNYLSGIGLSFLDALHVTLAEKSKVDYFITCDDQIIRTYKKNRDVFIIPVVGLREFISLEEK